MENLEIPYRYLTRQEIRSGVLNGSTPAAAGNASGAGTAASFAPGQSAMFTPDPTVGGAWTHTRADVPLFRPLPTQAASAAQAQAGTRTGLAPSTWNAGGATTRTGMAAPAPSATPPASAPAAMPPAAAPASTMGQPQPRQPHRQGWGWGRMFQNQYGKPPGQMRDMWQTFRQQPRPDYRSMLAGALEKD